MKNKNWIRDARFVSWWLDFTDLSWPNPDLTSKWEARAEMFQKQGANAVVMFGFHFRWDYLPVMDRVFGALREIAEICHAHELKVVEHHSATLVHRVRNAQDRHQIQKHNRHHVPFYPDSWENVRYKGRNLATWRQISARDDKPVFFERYTCECFCPNHPEFQESYLEYIAEHLRAVPVDAVMSDDLHFLPDVYSCSCEHCRKRFEEEEGEMLPAATDPLFWEDYENPQFQAWLRARYRWNAEHYQRLRAALPESVALWGCASSCLNPNLHQIGFSPQQFAPYFDAIFHEIYHRNQPDTHSQEIVSELAGFASLARYYDKPLVALCYVQRPEDLSRWLYLLEESNARPWISKQVRSGSVPTEEEILAEGFSFPNSERQLEPEVLQAIVFSERQRDRLGPAGAQDYVHEFRQFCFDMTSRGTRVHVLFDSLWENAKWELWECLWIPRSHTLTPKQEQSLADWQRRGLAIGFL